jgi:hypothetical protein
MVAEKSMEFLKECPHDAHDFFTIFLAQMQAELNPNQTIRAVYGTEAKPINE